MKNTFKFLLATIALSLTACGGNSGSGAASSQQPSDPHAVTEEVFNKEVINAGFCGFQANVKLTLNMSYTDSSTKETIQGRNVLDMQDGKYHFYAEHGGDSHEEYTYAELVNDKVMTYYYMQDSSTGEWSKSPARENPNFPLDVKEETGLLTPAFSGFTYDKNAGTYTCPSYECESHGTAFVYQNIVLTFNNNKLVAYSFTTTYGGRLTVANATLTGFGSTTVTLPDGYTPTPIPPSSETPSSQTPSSQAPSGDQVSKEQFEAAIAEVDSSVRTSGSANIHVLVKQNGRANYDDYGTYTYTKVDGSWKVEGEGQGSAASMKNVYLHTVGRYATVFNQYLRNMDSYTMTYEVKDNGYKVTLTGKLDYSKMAPAYTGLLDQVFELAWDEAGMLTYWHFVLNGTVHASNGASATLEEDDLITASWN